MELQRIVIIVVLFSAYALAVVVAQNNWEQSGDWRESDPSSYDSGYYAGDPWSQNVESSSWPGNWRRSANPQSAGLENSNNYWESSGQYSAQAWPQNGNADSSGEDDGLYRGGRRRRSADYVVKTLLRSSRTAA